MKTFEEYRAEMVDAVRAGHTHTLTVCLPNQLRARELVKVSAGGKELRRKIVSGGDAEAVGRVAAIIRAELDDIEGTLRRMYATECEFKRRGMPSDV